LRLKLGRCVLIAVVLLSSIAAVRSVRSTGVGDLDRTIDVNPVHGLAELGYSLRPVAEMLQLQSNSEQPYGGRTFVRPVERMLSRIAPSIDVPPALSDPYLMNVVINRRVGPIGFSPVAEGVANFGIGGGGIYLALVGLLLGALDRRRPTTSGLVLTAVVLVPLLIQTRNSFVSVPFQWTVGLCIWLAVFRPRTWGVSNRDETHETDPTPLTSSALSGSTRR
jgi:hypothetical protein